MTRDTVRCRPV